MSSSIWRNWLRWAILTPCLLGCHNLFGTQGPPHDPLFLSKTPMTAKAQFSPPIAFAYLEPTVPRDSFLDKDAPVVVDKNDRKVPGTLTNRPSQTP
jgi:hypothetical protein